MAQINPPAFAHFPQDSSHKRKRSGSAAPGSSFSVERSGATNPLSYTPATLRQLQVAGHSDADLLPSTSVQQFPHRPLPPSPGRRASPFSGGASPSAAAAAASGWDTEGGEADDHDHDHDGDGDPEAARRAARGKQRRAEHAHRVADRHLGALTALAHRALEAGDVPRAARAFGLLVRSDVWGRPVDLRKNGYWALGAEILMRQGEGDADKKKDGGGEGWSLLLPRRWGRAVNMPAVKEYFMALIHQYPYNKFQPRTVSALDFWPALLGCQLYNTYVEHARALRRLELAEADDNIDDGSSDEEGGWGGLMDEDGDGDGDAAARAERRREARDQLRRGALHEMRDVARSMDNLMVGPPYSASHELLRLRGMVALYMGDLAMAPPRRSPAGGGGEGGEDDIDLHEARTQRDAERDRARWRFRKILEEGGEVEDWIRTFVMRGVPGGTRDDDDGGDDDEDDDSGIISLPGLSSSLPIRGR